MKTLIILSVLCSAALAVVSHYIFQDDLATYSFTLGGTLVLIFSWKDLTVKK
jgi:hypothetical protein